MDDSYEVEIISEKEIVYGPKRKKNDSSILSTLYEYFIRVVYWIHVICVFSSCGTLVFAVIVLTFRIWTVGILYLYWIYYDRATPHTGGRRLNFYRKLAFYRCHRDNFPIKLVKTAELPPDTTYLFVAHPHGIYAHVTQTNFLSDVNGFDHAYPGIKPHVATISQYFYIPITRDILLSAGICAVSKEGIAAVLNGPPGNASVIIVGGAKEFYSCAPGRYDIFLKNRKGFVRVALASGASLVPTFSFGENDGFQQISSEWYKWLQKKIHIFGKPIIILKGCGKNQPYAKPATTVVGAPIKLPKIENPSQEIVDHYHGIFIKELVKLFNEYKGKYDENGNNAVLNVE